MPNAITAPFKTAGTQPHDVYNKVSQTYPQQDRLGHTSADCSFSLTGPPARRSAHPFRCCHWRIARVFNPEYGRNTKDAAARSMENQFPARITTKFIHAQAATSLMAGRNIAGMPRSPVIERLAWKRLLTLKEAQRLKLSVSEQEVSRQSKQPCLQENGQFNVQRFQVFAPSTCLRSCLGSPTNQTRRNTWTFFAKFLPRNS